MTDTRVGPVLPGLRHVHSGKVRDSYALPDEPDLLLIVASDRISAYDAVLQTPIPDKGRVLTQLSLWWFDRLASAHGRQLGPHHVVSGDDPRIPAAVRGRAMLVRRLEMIPVECVARGYLAGSGLADYRTRGAVVDVALPSGLLEGSRLPEPIFTPATKAEQGAHDENVSYAAVQAAVGSATAAELRRRTLAVYQWAHDIARERGIVLADTKLEFGRPPKAPSGELVLGDEVLTPDSSRLWPADRWRAGRAQPSYDKQFLRDWLTSPASGWDRGSTDPPPPLPEEIVERTRQRYIDAYERLTGARFG